MLSALKSAMELRNPADTEQLLDYIFAYADSNKLPPGYRTAISAYIFTSSRHGLQFPNGRTFGSRAAAFPRSSALWNNPSPRWNPAPAHVQQTQDMAQSSAASADHIVSSVQAYISATLASEQLSLDQLAQQFYLEAQVTSRACLERETGSTLTTYLQNVRIRAAKICSHYGAQSYEVAEQVGITIPCISPHI